jgi:tRNA(adenine34) deaminase
MNNDDIGVALDLKWMRMALELAHRAQDHNEVPVGAVIVQEGKLVGQGWNRPISSHDPTAHAEIIALRDAGRALQNYRLCNTTLYVTLEPCAMCLGAMVHARIDRLVFGAFDLKSGAVTSAFALLEQAHFNHQFTWQGGVLAEECGLLLSAFFKNRRGNRG